MKATPIYLLMINFILIGGVSLTALVIMLYWNRVTGGRLRKRPGRPWRPIGGWKDHPAGQSLMGLLGIVFFITFNAAIQGMIPLPIEIKAAFYFLLYIVFIVALARIGLTIRSEVNRNRSKRNFHPESGDINISHLKEDSDV